MNKEKWLELCSAVWDLNGGEQRRRSLTDNSPTSFMSFFGHVAQIDIRIYPEGWGSPNDSSSEYANSFCFDAEHFQNDSGKVDNTINAIKSFLEARKASDVSLQA
jgi:hypothetical protein